MRRQIRVVQRLSLFGVGAALLSMGYTNCAPAQFQDALSKPSIAEAGEAANGGGSGVGGGGSGSADPTRPPSNVVVPGSSNPNIVPVREACAGVMRETTVPVSFANPYDTALDKANVCAWNSGGNADLVNDHFSARVEQNVDFALPSGAKICGMEFQFNEQQVAYDDHIFFVFDDTVIMASQPIENYLPYADGIYNWSWAALVGKPWTFGNETNYSYCLGESQGLSTCRFPQTEMEGAMKLEFSTALFQSITARNLNRPVHQFKFVTMGDNDPHVDCRHTPFSFNVKVRWAQ